jgi:hypothetical protein
MTAPAVGDAVGAPAQPVMARWTARLDEEEAKAFDHFVAEARGGHFAQSRAYLPVALASHLARPAYVLVRRAGRLIGAAQVLRGTAGPLPLPVAWIERGPVCDHPGELTEVVRAVAAAARARGVLRLSVMPYFAGEEVRAAAEALGRARFRPRPDPAGAHTCTLRLPLSPGEDPFLGGAYRSLRSTLKQAERLGVTVRRTGREGIALLAGMHDRMMAEQGRRGRPARIWAALADGFDALGAGLFVAELGGADIAAALTLRHGRVVTFVHGATSLEEQRFSKMGLPLAAAIRAAQEAGAHTFDLGGVPAPSDQDPKRAAIARFKWHFAKTPTALLEEHVRWG